MQDRTCTLTVHHHDDTVTVHEGVTYRLRPDGVTVVDADGNETDHDDVLHTEAEMNR